MTVCVTPERSSLLPGDRHIFFCSQLTCVQCGVSYTYVSICSSPPSSWPVPASCSDTECPVEVQIVFLVPQHPTNHGYDAVGWNSIQMLEQMNGRTSNIPTHFYMEFGQVPSFHMGTSAFSSGDVEKPTTITLPTGATICSEKSLLVFPVPPFLYYVGCCHSRGAI